MSNPNRVDDISNGVRSYVTRSKNLWPSRVKIVLQSIIVQVTYVKMTINKQDDNQKVVSPCVREYA